MGIIHNAHSLQNNPLLESNQSKIRKQHITDRIIILLACSLVTKKQDGLPRDSQVAIYLLQIEVKLPTLAPPTSCLHVANHSNASSY